MSILPRLTHRLVWDICILHGAGDRDDFGVLFLIQVGSQGKKELFILIKTCSCQCSLPPAPELSPLAIALSTESTECSI